MSKEVIDRQNKIIVALFLCLGKSLRKLHFADRNITVTESEIREAWLKQESPVRLISSNNVTQDGWAGEGAFERVFKVVLGDLDLKKTGMDLNAKMPEEPKLRTPMDRPKRCFDLE